MSRMFIPLVNSNLTGSCSALVQISKYIFAIFHTSLFAYSKLLFLVSFLCYSIDPLKPKKTEKKWGDY
jgi:hypothetical protein